jgi:alpha-beta hydrolase superfamily lysophospholipase
MIFKRQVGEPNNGWVILVHGLGEHCGRYDDFMQLLADHGFSVYAFDWAGHGRSEGKQGHATMEDTFATIDEITDEIGEKPFLFGHSLGGLAIIRYAELHPDRVKGLVASAPMLARNSAVSRLSVAFSKLLGSIVPSLTVHNRIDPADISRNEEAVEAYRDDPLVHHRTSTALAKSMFTHLAEAHRDAEKITVPILLLLGTADVLVPPRGARRFMKELVVEDKTLKEFEGAYHEVCDDPEWRDTYHDVIVRWLLDHC